MSDASSNLCFADLYREVSNYLGLGSAPADADKARCQRYANDGYRAFLMGLDPRTQRAYAWSFLAPEATLVVWPSVVASANTVSGACVEGMTTLTAAQAAFFPSMAGHSIAINGVGSFEIATWLSATGVVVTGDATCAARSFAVESSGAYSLADDCASLADSFTFASGGPRIALAARSPQYVRQLQSQGGLGAPRYFAVQPRAARPGGSQRHEVIVWPAPAAACTLRYRYRVAAPAMAADGDVPLGGPQHAPTILQAALMTAEQRHNDAAALHTERFAQLMAASIDLDAANKAQSLGGF